MKRGRSKLPIKSALVVLVITTIIVVVSDCVMYGVIGIFFAGLFLVLALRYTDKFLMQKKVKVIDYTYTKGLSIPTGMTLMDERGRRIHLNDYSGNLPGIGESTNIAIPYEYLDMKDIDGIMTSVAELYYDLDDANKAKYTVTVKYESLEEAIARRDLGTPSVYSLSVKKTQDAYPGQ